MKTIKEFEQEILFEENFSPKLKPKQFQELLRLTKFSREKTKIEILDHIDEKLNKVWEDYRDRFDDYNFPFLKIMFIKLKEELKEL
ncbi:MAG: hypothetical protein FVQ78_10015 [Solirubrobacterales bacterium]|nr:hypothetical protein [Solirubrobacterales bacterium]